jgi:hypothetical protein
MGGLPVASFTRELTQTHELSREWADDESNTRYELYAPLAGSGSPVFVKHLPPDQEDGGRATYDLLVALDRAVRQRPADERLYVTPRPVARGSDPPYIAYHWVAGRELRYALAELVDGPSGADEVGPRRAHELARAAGRGLAQLHHDLVRAAAGDGAPLSDLAGECPRWFSPLRSSRRARGGGTVPAIGDLGPWNIVVGTGPIVFIDLLISRRRPPDIDVGRLAYFLLDKAGPALRRRDAIPLARSVVDGYLSVPAGGRPEVSRRRCLYAAFVCGLIRNVQRLSGRTGRFDRRHTVRRLGWTLELARVAVWPGSRSATPSAIARRARPAVASAESPPTA